MTKRVLSLLLVLVMALSLSVPAFADGEDGYAAGEPATDAPAPIAEWIPVTSEENLKLALTAKQNPIELMASFALSEKLSINYNVDLRLGTYQLDTTSYGIEVGKGVTLTVSATKTAAGIGGISGAKGIAVGVAGKDNAKATLTVNSGYVEAISVVNGNVSVPASSTANIYTVSATASAVGTISVAGGTIGNAVVPANGPVLQNQSRELDVTISGGEFYAKDYTIQNTTERNYITGGTFIPRIDDGGDDADAAAADVALNTTYATFKIGKVNCTVVGQAAVEAMAKELTSGDEVNVQQGNATLTGVAAGVTAKNSGEGTVTVDGVEVDSEGTKYVARIGSQGYGTLKEAVDEATKGDTITLLDNIKLTEDLAIKESVTLDLNKKVLNVDTHKLSFDGTGAAAASLIPSITVSGAGNIMGASAGKVELNGVKLTLDDVNIQPEIISGDGSYSNSLTVDADSIVVSIGGTTAFEPKKGTVTIEGTVNGDVQINGDDCKVVIKDGASIGGETKLGTGTDYMDIAISGGTFSDKVTITAEEHAPVAITGGTFKGETSPITLNTVEGVISGGIYNTQNLTDEYVKTGCGAAVITDSNTKTPYKYSGYTFVGDTAVAEGLANVAKGSIKVTAGTVTLASIGNDITVATGNAKEYLKVGNVTVGNATGSSGASAVPGAKINELNAEISTAQRAQVSGKLTDEALQDLVDAYMTAIGAQGSKAAVQDSIDGLKKALVGYEDEETPTAPASGTGWVETASGEWYYFLNGTMVKNQWVESGRALWYYMNPDGTLAHGGLTLVPTCRGINKDGKDAGTFAAGYFYLRHNNYNGCIGQARHGSVAIEASTVASVPAKGTGVFETKHNGHYGACVSINGKAVKNYTELPA